MSMLRLTIGVLTVFGILIGSQIPGAAAGGDKDEYTVVINKVEIKKTKANGEAWDVNDGAPDLRVFVRNTTNKDEKAFETKEKKDTYSAVFDEPANFKVKKGQSIEIEVVDVDVAVNDQAGKTILELSDEHIRKAEGAKGKLRLENFGQVVYVDIQLKKL
jgi:hypothetical protein